MAECGKKDTCKNYDKKCSQCWANSSIYDTHPCYTSKDLVEVVRCKNCQYWQDKNSKRTQGICLCGEKDMNYGGEFYPLANDFCSYGKSRTPKERGGEK